MKVGLLIALLIASSYGSQCKDAAGKRLCKKKIKRISDYCETDDAMTDCPLSCDLCGIFVRTCQKSSFDIQCPQDEIIRIITAMYGRLVADVCPGVGDSTTGCGESVIGIVKSLCEGKPDCQFKVGIAVLPDTCPNHDKHLDVKYRCAPRDISGVFTELKHIADEQAKQISALLTTTQQQTSSFNQQQTEMAELKQQVQTEADQVAELKQQVQNLSTKNDDDVFFTAVLTKGSVTLSIGETLVYNTVHNNIGNGYNTVTGVFTSPLDGYYQFNVYMLSQANLRSRLAIFVNGKETVSLFANANNGFQSGSNSAIYLLRKNDVVQVKATLSSAIWAPSPTIDLMNTFSGFLLTVL